MLTLLIITTLIEDWLRYSMHHEARGIYESMQIYFYLILLSSLIGVWLDISYMYVGKPTWERVVKNTSRCTWTSFLLYNNKLVYVASRICLALESRCWSHSPPTGRRGSDKADLIRTTIIIYLLNPILDYATEDIHWLWYMTCIDAGKCKVQLTKRC